MGNDVEVIKKKMKSQKILLVLLSVILVLSIGVSGYFIYDNIKDNENNSNNDLNNNQGNNNNEPQVVDITNTDLAKNLHKTLITCDGSYGLYFSDKVSITDISNKKLLNFFFRNYTIKNNISSQISNCGGENYGVKIEKADFNYFIKNNYGTNYKYNFAVGDSINLAENYVIKNNNDEYLYYCNSGSSLKEKASNIMLKAEQINDDIIYIYDKVVYCEGIGPMSLCYNLVDNDCNELSCMYENLVYRCSIPTGDYIKPACTTDGPSVIEEMPTYILNNMKDKLLTFKHTFKKEADGNYYWISSEISK